MDKLFENAAAIIKESAKSILGFGSLLILAVATVGVLMFKDSKDEHIKLYAFLALLGAFLLCLFTLARTTKKVVQKEEQAAQMAAPPVMGYGEPAPHYHPQQPRRSSGTGCVVGLVLFGLVGLSCIVLIVGVAMMDLAPDEFYPMQNSGAGMRLDGGGGAAPASAVSGYISTSDAILILNSSGEITITLYPVAPSFEYGLETFRPNEIIASQQGIDGFGNPVTFLTVDADVVRERAMNE